MATKLVLAIVNDEDCNRLLDETMKADFSATRLSTSGGFLRAGNTTLLFGIDEEKLDKLIEIIGECCSKREELVEMAGFFTPELMHSLPAKVIVGGATVFVLDVERFIKL